MSAESPMRGSPKMRPPPIQIEGAASPFAAAPVPAQAPAPAALSVQSTSTGNTSSNSSSSGDTLAAPALAPDDTRSPLHLLVSGEHGNRAAGGFSDHNPTDPHSLSAGVAHSGSSGNAPGAARSAAGVRMPLMMRHFSPANGIITHVSHSLKIVNEGRAAPLIHAMEKHLANNGGALGSQHSGKGGKRRRGGKHGGANNDAGTDSSNSSQDDDDEDDRSDDGGGRRAGASAVPMSAAAALAARTSVQSRPNPVLEAKKLIREERRALLRQLREEHERQLLMSGNISGGGVRGGGAPGRGSSNVRSADHSMELSNKGARAGAAAGTMPLLSPTGSASSAQHAASAKGGVGGNAAGAAPPRLPSNPIIGTGRGASGARKLAGTHSLNSSSGRGADVSAATVRSGSPSFGSGAHPHISFLGTSSPHALQTSQSGNNHPRSSSSSGGDAPPPRFAVSIFDRIPRFVGLAGHYEKHQMLGQGSFGATWLVEWVPEGSSSAQSRSSEVGNGHTDGGSALQASRSALSVASESGRNSSDGAAAGPTRAPINMRQMFVPHAVTAAVISEGSFTAAGSSSTSTRQPQQAAVDVIVPPRRAGPSPGAFAAGHEAQQQALLLRHLQHLSSNPLSSHAVAAATAFYTVPTPGGISSLACTKSYVRLTNGREVPSDRVFVCKVESNAAAARKQQISSQEFSEERILSKCAHPCIVGFIDEFNDDSNHYLIMEYVDGGDVRGEIQRRLDADTLKYFSEPSLLFLFTQIIMGLEYMHRHNILHRDLKTSNLLLSRKWSVRIADFGFAKQFDVDVDNNASITTLGTPYYMAPEVLTKGPYSDKADIWSVGVVLYELITLHRPFDADTVQELARRIVHDEYDPIERDTISDEVLDLVHAMLQKDPAKRPSAKQILQQPVMVASMDEFINKFTRAANASSSPLDKLWAKVLVDHRDLVLSDCLTSSKSRTQQQRARGSEVSARFGSQNMGSIGPGADSSAGGGGGGMSRRTKSNNSKTGGGGSSPLSYLEDDDGTGSGRNGGTPSRPGGLMSLVPGAHKAAGAAGINYGPAWSAGAGGAPAAASPNLRSPGGNSDF